MKLREMFESKYFRAADLKGQRLTLTIKRVKKEQIGDDKKTVVYFQESDKGLVLNITNSRSIEEITGTDEADVLPGHKIVLYTTVVDFKGRRVDAIRIDKPTATDVSEREESRYYSLV
jgi:hypothetical protein